MFYWICLSFNVFYAELEPLGVFGGCLVPAAGVRGGAHPLCVGSLVPQGRWQSQMQQLRDMGIQDEELTLRALQATDGDIQAALELIFAGGPGL